MKLGPACGSGGSGERNVDTIRVGHVRVEENKRVPYILPSSGAGLRLAGESSRDLTCVCAAGVGGGWGAQPPGLRALGEGGGWEGVRLALPEPRREEEGLRGRGGRAWRKREPAGAALLSQPSWARPLLSLLGPSSKPAAVSTESGWHWGDAGPQLSFRSLSSRVAAPDPCPYPALPQEAPLPPEGASWAGQNLTPLGGEGSGAVSSPPPPRGTSDGWGLGERVCVPA